MARSHRAIKNERAAIKVALISVGNKLASSRVWESERERDASIILFYGQYIYSLSNVYKITKKPSQRKGEKKEKDNK
jgi:hypothetical protein